MGSQFRYNERHVRGAVIRSEWLYLTKSPGLQPWAFSFLLNLRFFADLVTFLGQKRLVNARIRNYYGLLSLFPSPFWRTGEPL